MLKHVTILISAIFILVISIPEEAAAETWPPAPKARGGEARKRSQNEANFALSLDILNLVWPLVVKVGLIKPHLSVMFGDYVGVSGRGAVVIADNDVFGGGEGGIRVEFDDKPMTGVYVVIGGGFAFVGYGSLEAGWSSASGGFYQEISLSLKIFGGGIPIPVPAYSIGFAF